MSNRKTQPIATNVVMGAPVDVQFVRVDITDSVWGAFTFKGDGTVSVPLITLEFSEAEERFLSDDNYWRDSGITAVPLSGAGIARLEYADKGARHARLRLDNTAGVAGTVQKIWMHGKP